MNNVIFLRAAHGASSSKKLESVFVKEEVENLLNRLNLFLHSVNQIVDIFDEQCFVFVEQHLIHTSIYDLKKIYEAYEYVDVESYAHDVSFPIDLYSQEKNISLKQVTELVNFFEDVSLQHNTVIHPLTQSENSIVVPENLIVLQSEPIFQQKTLVLTQLLMNILLTLKTYQRQLLDVKLKMEIDNFNQFNKQQLKKLLTLMQQFRMELDKLLVRFATDTLYQNLLTQFNIEFIHSKLVFLSSKVNLVKSDCTRMLFPESKRFARRNWYQG